MLVQSWDSVMPTCCGPRRGSCVNISPHIKYFAGCSSVPNKVISEEIMKYRFIVDLLQPESRLANSFLLALQDIGAICQTHAVYEPIQAFLAHISPDFPGFAISMINLVFPLRHSLAKFTAGTWNCVMPSLQIHEMSYRLGERSRKKTWDLK